jgi:hypothetical protein
MIIDEPILKLLIRVKVRIDSFVAEFNSGGK